MLKLLLTPLKWLLALGLFAGLLYGLFYIHERTRGEEEREENEAKAQTSQQTINGIVKLEKDEAERYGLETEPARALQWYERVVVYGRVIPNPRATTEIRSPFAGTLRAAAKNTWPIPGQWVRAKQTLGWVDIRVGPDVRLDLQNKLTEARIKQSGAEEELKAQEDHFNVVKEGYKKQISTRNELDAALVQLVQARTNLATAKAAAEQWQKAIQEVEHHKDGDHSLWSHALAAPCDGEVTDLAGRPGMVVEAGTLIALLVDFRHPLIRLDFPPEIVARKGAPKRLEVHVPSFTTPALDSARAASPSAADPLPIQAQLVGPAPRVDATSQFASYLYDAHLDDAQATKDSRRPHAEHGNACLWRPGMQVAVEVRDERTAAQPAVTVPAGAILYHQGQPLVYVRVDEETYERRVVQLLGRQGDRWIVTVRQSRMPAGVAPKEAVVSRQAQVLLSKEFLAASLEND